MSPLCPIDQAEKHFHSFRQRFLRAAEFVPFGLTNDFASPSAMNDCLPVVPPHESLLDRDRHVPRHAAAWFRMEAMRGRPTDSLISRRSEYVRVELKKNGPLGGHSCGLILVPVLYSSDGDSASRVRSRSRMSIDATARSNANAHVGAVMPMVITLIRRR